MKKILITGVAGFVGLNVLEELKDSKYRIIGIDKDLERLNLAKKINKNIEIIHTDLSIKGDWEKLFRKIDCVVQLQAQISHPEKEPYIKNNVDSVRNVIEVCEKYKVKNLIHISSSVVISVSKDKYVETKTIGENLAKKCKIPYTILRPPLMYGPYNTKHLTFIIQKFNKFPFVIVPGNGKYIRQPLYVKDFARIITKLINPKPKKKIYNIIGKENIFFIDLLKIMFRARGKRKLFIKIPLPLFILLMSGYNLISWKKPFVIEQLKALIAGDIFPVTNWDEEFKINYTSFKEGAIKMLK